VGIGSLAGWVKLAAWVKLAGWVKVVEDGGQ